MAIASKYAASLSLLVRDMVRDYYSVVKIYAKKKSQMKIAGDAESWLSTDVEKRLKSLDKKWQDAFDKYADTQSKKVIEKVLKQTDLQLKETLKGYLAENMYVLVGQSVPTPLKQTLKIHTIENAALIKSIPAQFAERISGVVYRAITGESPINDVKRDLNKYGKMSMRRAKLVAGDQTRKAFTDIAVKRLEQVGVKKAKWLHTGAGKTFRDYHHRKWDGVSGLKDGRPNGLNGFIFSVNNPPVIDLKTGERGFPNRLPFCHCKMVAVVEYDKI